ncbi:MAG TPA: CDP-alcohol phosphatidyltransferase family protein [Candidatus Eisenbacteria bacterium]|nr:CDP-alcohol phosphatidyltransferase family protein [Candidatus Eisenbacteria bacterium]
MFAEDLLREVRRDGFAPSSVAIYLKRVSSRIVRKLSEEPELVRSVAATSFLLFAVQFGGALLLTWAFGRRVGIPYLVASSVILLLASVWILIHIGLGRGTLRGRLPTAGLPLRRIPLPVALTLLRLVSVPAIVLLIREQAWVAVVWLFTASALTDVLDGFAARALRAESEIGAVLDPAVDVFFNVAVFVALAMGSILPWWVSGLMLVRYALLALGTCYLYLFHGPVKIQPTAFGKLTGVLTSVLVGLVLTAHATWSATARGRLLEVFDVGLAVLGLATILQVLVIGFANKKEIEMGHALADALASGETADPRAIAGKVVGDVRWPRG